MFWNDGYISIDHSLIYRQQDDGTWTFVVRSYNDRDGLQPGPFNQRAIYCSSDGHLLIGGQEGLDIISTLRLNDNDGKEKAVFSGLELFGQLVEVGADMNGRVILKEALDQQRSITLKNTENQFTILMASDNGGVNNKTRFAYRLKGFNDMWIKTSIGQADITYMGLPPGSYTLCVRILHDDGTMDEEESELDIEILSPWYRSWWAWIIYLLLIGLLFFERKKIIGLFKGLGKKENKPSAETPSEEIEEEEVIEEAVMMEDESEE